MSRPADAIGTLRSRPAGPRLGVGAASIASLAALLACGGTQRAVESGPAPQAAAAGNVQATVADYPLGPPPLGTPVPLRVPPVAEHRLSNGLRVLVVQHDELPLVDMILAVRTGGEADPPDRAGVATLTADLLDEGTATRDALAISEQAALIGASISTSAGWDVSSISIRGNTATLDSALALLADVLLNPAFPEAELERLRTDRLTSLMQVRDRGPAIADRVFNEVVFGTDHPYGRPLSGTEGSTARIARDDIVDFYRTYYRPNNSVLVVVGDVQPADLLPRLERLLGSWERSDAIPAPVMAAAPPTAAHVYVVDRPGSPQTSVRIGTTGVARNTPDYFPLLVMNTTLGGSFTSRLNQNLRETHGYTYGAGSRFNMRRDAGPFVASAEVVAAKTDSSLIEFMKELRAIAEPVPTDELEKTRRYLQLQLPGSFETPTSIARELLAVALYDLPLNYFDSYAQRIDAVTQADVKRVVDRYIRPESLVIVAVGDRESIEPAIRAAGFSNVSVRQFTP